MNGIVLLNTHIDFPWQQPTMYATRHVHQPCTQPSIQLLELTNVCFVILLTVRNVGILHSAISVIIIWMLCKMGLVNSKIPMPIGTV
jgi:hypothetical protein